MKKSIEIKGVIDVDKSEMKEIRAGESCAESGIACLSVIVKPTQNLLETVVIVDKLYV